MAPGLWRALAYVAGGLILLALLAWASQFLLTVHFNN